MTHTNIPHTAAYNHRKHNLLNSVYDVYGSYSQLFKLSYFLWLEAASVWNVGILCHPGSCSLAKTPGLGIERSCDT